MLWKSSYLVINHQSYNNISDLTSEVHDVTWQSDCETKFHGDPCQDTPQTLASCRWRKYQRLTDVSSGYNKCLCRISWQSKVEISVWISFESNNKTGTVITSATLMVPLCLFSCSIWCVLSLSYFHSSEHFIVFPACFPLWCDDFWHPCISLSFSFDYFCSFWWFMKSIHYFLTKDKSDFSVNLYWLHAVRWWWVTFGTAAWRMNDLKWLAWLLPNKTNADGMIKSISRDSVIQLCNVSSMRLVWDVHADVAQPSMADWLRVAACSENEGDAET